MNHMDSAGYNLNVPMTAVLPMATVVYTGDGEGRVVSSLDKFPPSCQCDVD